MVKAIEGIIAPLVTPFDEAGRLDAARAKGEIRRLLDAGVDGISPGGSTGEGAALTDGELAELVRLIRAEDPEIPVVAGVIRNSTPAAVSAGLAAKEAGADALMVTPVSYNVLVPDDEGNYKFNREISDRVGLPIESNNVEPQNTITAPLFGKLLEIENVVGIKQSVGGIMAFYEMKMVNGKRGKVFSATDDMLCSTYELGADGAISAILTVFPELCVEMWKDFKEGRREHALELQNRMYFTWQAIAGSQFPIRIKYALRLMGRDAGWPRGPICHMGEEEKRRIRGALEEGGFLETVSADKGE